MSTGAAIVGVGMTRHGFMPESSWRDLVVESVYEALEDSGVDAGEVDTGYVSVTLPHAIEQQNLGPLAADELAMMPAAFVQMVAACAGGTIALQSAVAAVASGRSRIAVVVGVEKVSDAVSIGDTMMPYLDAAFEAPIGVDGVDSMALMQQRYVTKYGARAEDIAQFVVQDRWYAARNPLALEYKRPPLAVDDVLDAPVVSGPITMPACGKVCDGSSALILMSEDEARRRSPRGVEVAGIGQATGPNVLATKFFHPLHADGADISEAVPTQQAAAMAYREARITPEEIDVVQVHDCFAVMGSLHLEGLGLFPRGSAAKAVGAGETALDGRIPTNTDGGRIGLGHPTGATGVSIVVESVRQLRGECGERQVDGCDTAVAQSMGGGNATSAVAVLRKI